MSKKIKPKQEPEVLEVKAVPIEHGKDPYKILGEIEEPSLASTNKIASIKADYESQNRQSDASDSNEAREIRAISERQRKANEMRIEFRMAAEAQKEADRQDKAAMKVADVASGCGGCVFIPLVSLSTAGIAGCAGAGWQGVITAAVVVGIGAAYSMKPLGRAIIREVVRQGREAESNPYTSR